MIEGQCLCVYVCVLQAIPCRMHRISHVCTCSCFCVPPMSVPAFVRSLECLCEIHCKVIFTLSL